VEDELAYYEVSKTYTSVKERSEGEKKGNNYIKPQREAVRAGKSEKKVCACIIVFFNTFKLSLSLVSFVVYSALLVADARTKAPFCFCYLDSPI
jgi:hypothetical protein